MPVWLRRFTYNKVLEHYKKLKEESEEDTVETSIQTLKQHSPKISVPDYVVPKPKS